MNPDKAKPVPRRKDVSSLGNPSSPERATVQRTVEAIMMQAEFQATAVATLLGKLGLKSQLSKHGEYQLTDATRSSVSTVLLDLGAAVQIRSWERAGQKKHLPLGLPNAVEAIAVALDSARRATTQPRLADTVFRVWCQNFAYDSRPTLGSDILLSTPDAQLVERLADFLWEVGGVQSTKGGNCNGD